MRCQRDECPPIFVMTCLRHSVKGTYSSSILYYTIYNTCSILKAIWVFFFYRSSSVESFVCVDMGFPQINMFKTIKPKNER